MSLKQIKMAIGDTYTHFGFTYDPDKLMREHKTTIFKRLYDFKPEMKAYYQKILESSGLTEEKVAKFLEAKKNKKESTKKEGVKVKRSELGKGKTTSTNAKLANIILLREEAEKEKKESEKVLKQIEKERKELAKMREMDKDSFIGALLLKTKQDLINRKSDLQSEKLLLKLDLQNKKLAKMQYNKAYNEKASQLELYKQELKLKEEKPGRKNSAAYNASMVRIAELKKLIPKLEEELAPYDEEVDEEMKEIKKDMLAEVTKIDKEMVKITNKLKKIEEVDPEEPIEVKKFVLKQLGISEEELDDNLILVKSQVKEKYEKKLDERAEKVAEAEQKFEEVRQQAEIQEAIEEKKEEVIAEHKEEIKQEIKEEAKQERVEAPPRIMITDVPVDLVPVPVAPVPPPPPIPEDEDIPDVRPDVKIVLDAAKIEKNFKKAVKGEDRPLSSILSDLMSNPLSKLKKASDRILPAENLVPKKTNNLSKAMQNLQGPIKQILDRRQFIDSDNESDFEDSQDIAVKNALKSDLSSVEETEEDQKGSGIIGGCYMMRPDGGGFITPEFQYAVCRQFGGFISADNLRRVTIQPYVNRALKSIVASGGSILDVAKGIKKISKLF